MFALLAVLLSPATAFMAGQPRLVPAQGSRVPRCSAGPEMILGGAGRSIGRIARITTSKFPKMPRMDGSGTGDSNGGDGGDATPAPQPAGDDDGGNPFMMVWKAYNDKLESDPLIMKMLTSFTGFLLGDILAQTCIEKKGFSWSRLLRLSSFGFLIHGSTSHYFYGFLDGKLPGATAGMVALKVFIDQVLWNPIFGVMFFGYVAALERKGISYVADKVKNELMTQVTGSWKVWPIAHAINFRFIPSSQRVLYINSIQIGYNCFLSIIASR